MTRRLWGLFTALLVFSTAFFLEIKPTFGQSSAQPEKPSTPGANPGPKEAPFGLPPEILMRMGGMGGGGGGGGDDFPPLEKVTEGYEKVVSTTDGQPSLYTIWVRRKDGQMLAELPRNYMMQKHFIAMTVASGELYAGLQAGDMYVYWKQYDKRLALIEPNVETRSTGDSESRSSVNRLFTDRVILDVPILTFVPRGGPVIDLDELLIGHSSQFFGPMTRSSNPGLSTIKTAKAFPNNVEIGIEVPIRDGRLETLHYSISLIPDNTGYTPRVADERVGYFTTAYSDLGKFKEREVRTRFINRWHLEKADPSLDISPPRNPIVFYIESTTPVRYRRWVREGLLYWNKAFEKVGISNAIEVYYQDAATGAHMEKDPEDVRYNFIRWLNNNIGTAIGPSRTHPLTGQILDADIILTDGWIRHFWKQFNEVLPEVAVEGFSAETMAWLDAHPNWDPRYRLAPFAERDKLLAERQRAQASSMGGHPVSLAPNRMLGGNEFDGLIGRISQTNGLCLASRGKAIDMATMRMYLDMVEGEDEDELDPLATPPATLPATPPAPTPPPADPAKPGEPAKVEKPKDEKPKDEKKEEKKDEKKDEKPKEVKAPKPKPRPIDGMPEAFVGPLLADLVAHEVGHTLGLRHNFKASSIYTLAEINSKAVKGVKPFTGSVMDYIPVNMDMKSGEIQGDYGMIGLGPYDYWAIEYGYSFTPDLKPILERVAEPELAYATDEDTGGPDPLARRYDFSKNPLDYAKNQIRLATYQRGRILDKFVKDGESWSKARSGYELTLLAQTQSVSTMANWVGGSSIHRDRKGDKNARSPIEQIPAQTQREALQFVIDNAFFDEAFGVTPELLAKMTVDKWLDGDGARFALNSEPTWPVHDRIMGIQASALTMLMNPTTLRRVYDNEFRTPADQDALTLPELIDTVTKAIWKELDKKADQPFTSRKPLISSLRRNLQREHMERLIDLVLPSSGFTAAQKPISNLAMAELREIRDSINRALTDSGKNYDPYTLSHLTETRERITKALDAQYIYNAKDLSRGGQMIFFQMGEDGAKSVQPENR